MVHLNVKKTFLVVEDEHVISNICFRILTREGFNVFLANDGNTAIELLDRQKFDLCLLDVRTPGVDGIDIYKYICKISPELSSRVIFMTGDSLSKNIPEFVNKIGCQLLEKPFTTDDLLLAVRNL